MSSLLDRPLRAAILAAANAPLVQRTVTRFGMQVGARRFVAGESADEFLPVAQAVNARGFAVAATLLGESVRDRAETVAVTKEYCRLLKRLAERSIDANVAFKLTHVGLDIDRELAYENAARIAATARETGNSIRLDMEQSSYVDRTLEVYRRLRAEFDNVGFVLQSYLYRSQDDLAAMLPLAPNLRIVKGAYLEPDSIAYPKKRDVDKNYLKLAEIALSHDGYTAIATHDAAIVESIAQLAGARGLSKRGRFEFQMLYGIAAPLARGLVERGYRVRLAVPFGAYWFPYLMRRLAERPANVAFFVKGAFALR
jgi:proline dehydrogenase